MEERRQERRKGRREGRREGRKEGRREGGSLQLKTFYTENKKLKDTAETLKIRFGKQE